MKASTITDFHTRYGPWAFVAGASVGLGAEFATQLAAKGLRLQGVDVLACCPAAVNTPNYLASAPDRSRRVSVSAMAPHAVVAEALAVLGKQPLIIPGRGNRLAHFVMQRLLPHPTAITLMGRVMRTMYAR